MKNSVIIISIAVVLIASSCKKDIAPLATCVDEISYTQDVKPIIDLNCSTSGCHDASTAGGYSFISYVSVSANASAILSVINHESGFTPMPYGTGKLADSTIQRINCWIQQGKLNN